MSGRSQLRAWNHVALDGGTIPVYSPHASYLKATLWAVPALFLYMLGFLSIIIVQGAIGFIIFFSIWYAGVGCLRVARRHVAKPAEEVLSRSVLRPVLYLRSFAQDGIRHELRLTDRFLHPVQYRFSPTFEERLVKHLSALGPVVTLGRPGEILPLTGASRVYVDDAHWQELVVDLLRRARLVMLQAGDSPGLQWEVNTSLQYLTPGQLLLFMPFQLSASKSKRRAAYFRFRGWASQHFPQELPEDAKNAALIRFLVQPHWKPELLPWKAHLLTKRRWGRRTDSVEKLLYNLTYDHNLVARDNAFFIILYILFGIIMFLVMPFVIMGVYYALRSYFL
jgi:hypothetical protein